MSDSLCKQLEEYVRTAHQNSPPDTKLFFYRNGLALETWHIHIIFRRVLALAKIQYHKGTGPTVHDLRHTFAVHSLKKLISSGIEINSGFVYLSKYLGHVSLRTSQYYLRLTADVYPSIIETVQNAFGEIVPKLED
jgi:integrase